jgi:hypothetical protein
LCSRSEVPRESQRHLGSHSATTPNNFIHSRRSDAKLLRQSVGTQLQGLHEIVAQNIARMHRTQFLGSHNFQSFDVSLVVIDDLNVERVPVLPLKTDTPLPIDPNAVLTFTVSLEGLELI